MTITKSKNLIYQTVAIMLTCLMLLAFAIEIDASVIIQPDSGLKIYNEVDDVGEVVLGKPKSDVIISDPATSIKDEQIQKIIAEAKILSPVKSTSFQRSYEPSLDVLTSMYGITRDREKEMNVGHALLALIYEDDSNWEAELKKQSLYDSMIYFITYGTETTTELGAGERAGVINSWKESKQLTELSIPEIAKDWEDIIKIANGRWLNVLPENDYVKEKEGTFRQIYLRDPDYSNTHDEAAMMTMAYGLRPQPRNVNSESEAIGFFKLIFDKDPTSASDWDITRAIAYSGATR
ncbi:MAG: hypothetical protein HQ538_01020 [Parcubacteria group bacterium]|nr:hypothetical protein [Parcubacteria group bacterium]